MSSLGDHTSAEADLKSLANIGRPTPRNCRSALDGEWSQLGFVQQSLNTLKKGLFSTYNSPI